jgi:hypothetical protein
MNSYSIDITRLTLKFRFLSIQFTLVRSEDECNGDFGPSVRLFDLQEK